MAEKLEILYQEMGRTRGIWTARTMLNLVQKHPRRARWLPDGTHTTMRGFLNFKC